jgi:hypothetical protein
MNLDIKDFLHALPESWKQPINTVAAIALLLFFFLKQSKDLFSTTTSKKNKEELLGEYLKKHDYLDKRIFEHFKYLQDSELFYRVTKIKCKKNLRDGLIWFHHNTSSKFSWDFIRSAIPYLHEQDWELSVQVPLLDRLYWSSFLILTIFIFLFIVYYSILIIIFYFYYKNQVNAAISLVALILLFIFLPFSWSQTLPVTRADIISREIKRIKGLSVKD